MVPALASEVVTHVAHAGARQLLLQLRKKNRSLSGTARWIINGRGHFWLLAKAYFQRNFQFDGMVLPDRSAFADPKKLIAKYFFDSATHPIAAC